MTSPLEPQSLERLEHPPLRLALVQVTTTPMLDVERTDIVQGLVSALADWVLLERRMAIDAQAMLGPAGITQSESRQRTVWVLSTAQDTVRASVSETSLAVESTAYDTWQTMHRAVVELLSAAAGVLAPQRCLRVGVRYVNELPVEVPAAAEQLRALLRSPLLGPLEEFGLPVRASVSELRLADTPGADRSLVVRHGVQPHGGYLLDLDAFIEFSEQTFDPEVLAGHAQELHDRIESVFCWALHPDALARLKDGQAL